MIKLWNIKPTKVLRTTREVRRVMIDERLNCGWIMKWGHYYDVPINGRLVQTGLSALTWTAQEWIDFINKNQKE